MPRSRFAVAALACLALLVQPALAEPLPSDPALVTGELDNGLRYVVRKHANPPGRAVVWIHIDTGSLNETDPQRGIAHYLEHMAFNGSANFKPGELIPFFQSMGMQFGRDQNAFTSLNQTVYQLTLPNVEPETLGKALTFFADVTHRLDLSPGEIEEERQIIQEERRTRLGGRQRVSEYISERLYPGSLLGVRSPIGTEATINSVQPADFQEFYGKWYGASNATVMVVADAEPEAVVKMIKDHFGDAAAKPRATPQDPAVKPYAQSFAIVASDEEIRSEELQVTRIEPAREPTLTVAQYRDDLVASLGAAVMNRRFGDKVAAGGAPYLSARVGTSNMNGVVYSASLSARASRGNWNKALDGAALELQRARKFGFTQTELDDQKKEILSSAEWAVSTEPSATQSALVSRINGGVNSGEPIMSASQRLEILQRLLPTITPQEVGERFAREFDFSTAAFVATLPAGGELPSESDLLAAGVKALSVEPTKEAEVARATTLLEKAPTPGTVVEMNEHAASKVWSGWLSNNVRVHYRYMDDRKDEVSIAINLLGGELHETAENRGITTAAQLAWGRAATGKLSSTDIRNLMSGKKVRVGGGGGMGGGRGGRGGGGGGAREAISLSISGAPADLEPGFQLAYLLLTDPKIEPAAFEQFKTVTKEMLQETLKNPAAAGARAAAVAPYPDDEPRVKPLEADDVDRIELAAAQAWLNKLIAESPIEVTIVGDVQKDQVMDLAAKYLGALPSRPKVETGMFADLRKLQRPAGPRVIEKAIETPTQQAFVLSGFYGPDENNRPDVRAMGVATRILSTRMVKQVREEAQLVYSIGAGSRPGSTFPGFGVVSAAAPTDPSKVDGLVAKLASMYETFAMEGPTAEELEVAKKQFANTFETQLKEPGYWSGRINLLTYRGVNLDEVVADPEAYQAITAEQVKDTFAKYWAKENSIVVVVRPKPQTTSTNGSGDKAGLAE